MSESDLLNQFILLRQQLDATIAQTVGMTLALFVGIYYFLHKAGWKLKTAVFILYLIGWYVFVASGGLAGEQMRGVLAELVGKAKSGEAGRTSHAVLEAMGSPTNVAYVIMVNAANFLLLIGATGFLFFWKPPAQEKERPVPDDT